MDEVKIVEADLGQPAHRKAVLTLVDAYARDPMGQGAPLAADVKGRLLGGLQAHPTTLILLAYHGENPVGIAVCFLGFSTFSARPLLNVHDLAVMPEHRGKGVGRRLLSEVVRIARERGCCKVTLEVHETNARARKTYAAAGFDALVPGTQSTSTLFLSKEI